MAKERPVWAEKRLQSFLQKDEQILFEAKGRVELNPPSGFGAVFYWLGYFLINILGFLYSLIVRKTSWLVITNKKIIILSCDGLNFPFWVIPFSRDDIDYTILKQNLSSICFSDNFIFWIIRSKGIKIESSGSLSIIFNGMSKEDFTNAHSIIANY